MDDEEEDDDQSDDSFDEEDENKQREIQYVHGDVTHPINTRGSDAIIVHCVGKWREELERNAMLEGITWCFYFN